MTLLKEFFFKKDVSLYSKEGYSFVNTKHMSKDVKNILSLI